MTPEHRKAVQGGLAKKRAVKLAFSLATLSTAVAPTVAEYVSTDIMGAAATDARGHDVRKFYIGDACVSSAKLGNTHIDQENGQNRGLVSHIRAQSAGAASMIRSAGVQHCWSVNSFDDASMWIQKKEFLKLLTAEDRLDKRVKDKLQRKGKNCHLPVLNLNESIFVDLLAHPGSSADIAAAGLELHSPGSAMPIASATTVYINLLKWAANSAERSGG